LIEFPITNPIIVKLSTAIGKIASNAILPQCHLVTFGFFIPSGLRLDETPPGSTLSKVERKVAF